jgi:group I intron endonuclease
MEITVIYLVRNKLNGKLYIGLTAKTAAERWKEHCRNARRGIETHSYRAIRKHGADAFEVSTIGTCRTGERKDLEFLERFCIEVKGSDRTGYNMTKGGEGRTAPVSETTKLKISQGLQGNKNRLGSKPSLATRQLMSTSHEGQKRSLASRQRMKDAWVLRRQKSEGC